MADAKLSALTELAATPAANDELYIRDESEAAADESKRITVANLMTAAIGNGCVLDLNGQEGTGSTISDISGQNNHGTITGATWVKLPSGLWWVNSFDGTGDTVTVADNATFQGTGSFTVMQWVKWDAFTQDYGGVVFANQALTWGIQTRTDGSLTFFVTDAVGDKGGNGSVATGTYYLITGVYSTTVTYPILYINTTPSADTNALGTRIVNNGGIIWGDNANAPGGGHLFIGKQTLKRYFNRALSASEIAAIYNEEKHLFAQPTIVSGEIRTASGSLTAGNANAMFFAWHNPELQDIYIKKVVINVGTGGGTVGSLGTVGIADDASYTNGGTEFFTALTLNNVAVYDSWLAGDTGAQTKWVFCQDSASATDGWVVGKITVQNAASLVGNYYIEYTGK